MRKILIVLHIYTTSLRVPVEEHAEIHDGLGWCNGDEIFTFSSSDPLLEEQVEQPRWGGLLDKPYSSSSELPPTSDKLFGDASSSVPSGEEGMSNRPFPPLILLFFCEIGCDLNDCPILEVSPLCPQLTDRDLLLLDIPVSASAFASLF